MDNSKVPVGFYLNAMVADWQGVLYQFKRNSQPTSKFCFLLAKYYTPCWFCMLEIFRSSIFMNCLTFRYSSIVNERRLRVEARECFRLFSLWG